MYDNSGINTLSILANTLMLNEGINRFEFVCSNKETKAYCYTFKLTDTNFKGNIRIRYNDGFYLVNGVYLFNGIYVSNNNWTRTEFSNIIHTMYVVLENLYKEYTEAVKVRDSISHDIKEQLKGLETASNANIRRLSDG